MSLIAPFDFHFPTKLIFGAGTLGRLGELAKPWAESVLVVGYRDQTGLEFDYDRAMRSLREAGVRPTTFFEIEPEPDVATVDRGAELARQVGAMAVVALGGGSVIDAAKVIALVAEMGGSGVDFLGGAGVLRPPAAALPIIAIPTTAGSGSEVSDITVLAQEGAGSTAGMNVKSPIFGPAIQPAIAIIDPELAEGSPASLTANAGADALGHAIETCLSRKANPITVSLSLRALGLIVGNLERAVAEPDNPVPRGPLALASTMAGISMTEVGLSVAHGMAQSLGGVLHVAHGTAVAVATRIGLRANGPHCLPQLAAMADACALGGDTPEEKAFRFAERIEDLLTEIGMPERIVPPADAPADLLDALVRNAMVAGRIPVMLNPRRIDRPELRMLFSQAVEVK